MEAKVSRGHLEVHDEKGSYRIPVGRKSRKCLAVLDQKEGEYTRSLELDLFTGFVYYCVDNATSGGLSYYYDMSSKKSATILSTAICVLPETTGLLPHRRNMKCLKNSPVQTG